MLVRSLLDAILRHEVVVLRSSDRLGNAKMAQETWHFNQESVK